jgi:hypothetical protein
VKTRHLQLVTHTHSVTVRSKSLALSPYGPVRAGLTTSQTTSDQQLTELLNCLERKIATLVSKSSTVLDTLEQGTKAIRALHLDTTNEEGGTDVNGS